MLARWIAALPGDGVGVSTYRLHLGQGHRHRSILAERADTRLVEPGCVALAGRLRIPVVGSLHSCGKVADDTAKIHSPKATGQLSGCLDKKLARQGTSGRSLGAKDRAHVIVTAFRFG